MATAGGPHEAMDRRTRRPALADGVCDVSAESEIEGWELVWSDEFDGDCIDPTKWDFDLSNGFFDYKSHRWIAGWGNEELQYYTRDPANVSVKDSLLTIRALKEVSHGCGYTSARLKTRRRDGTPLFTKRYGRFEFCAKVPSGKGLWPALWLLPQDDKYGGWAASGEIDVMEIVGEKPHRCWAACTSAPATPSARWSRMCTICRVAARWPTGTSTRWSGSRARFAGVSMACCGQRRPSGGVAA